MNGASIPGLARLVASCFGVGYAPRAPGTAGSLAALAIGAAILAYAPGWLPPAILLASLIGLWAVTAGQVGNDPGWVVIDEVAGQWLALLPLHKASWLGLAAAFALFRLFDIAKPGPVGWADRQHNPAGIMADDLMAGAIAAGILWAAQRLLPTLF